MNLFKTSTNNCSWVTSKFLKSLDIKSHLKTVERTVENHPEYPSILAVSDSLTEWKVDHEVYRFDKHDVSLESLPKPFIAHSMNYGGRFFLIEEIDSDRIIYSDEGIQGKKMAISDFIMLWDGVALFGEKNADSGEQNYFQSLMRYALEFFLVPAFIFVVLSSILLVMPKTDISALFCSLVSLKLLGISTCILLLIQSMNSNNPFIKSLCSIAGKGRCDELLKSDAAKITDWLNWSEVGFFYFASTFCLLVKDGAIPLVLMCNLFAIPFTIYSLTYQYRNKTWCILCCMVQAILILESVSLILQTGSQNIFMSSINFLSGNVFFITYTALLPIVTWGFFKKYLKASVEVVPLQKQLNKFKYNGDLFKKSLTNQPRFAVQNNLYPIIYGKPDAPIVITMISNLYCDPCGKAHIKLVELLDNRPDIQLKVVFVSNNFADGDQWTVTNHMVALNLSHNNHVAQDALQFWYSQKEKKYQELCDRFPVDIENYIEELRIAQKEWCELVGIKFTPTVLVNGYKLPDPYTIDDLKFLV